MGIKITGHLDPYIQILRELPWVKKISVEKVTLRFLPKIDSGWDGQIKIVTDRGDFHLFVEIKNSVKYSTIDLLVHRLGKSAKSSEVIIFSPYITRQKGETLAGKGFNFVDLAGNCHVKLSESYLVLKLGNRPPQKAPGQVGIRAQGYSVIFALLAEPSLVNAPVREIGRISGVSKTAAAERLQILESEGLLGRTSSGRQMLDYNSLLAKWLEGYAMVVQPEIIERRFNTPYSDPEDREAEIARILRQNKVKWAWGGLSAAWRLVGHYRGLNTLVHIENPKGDLYKKIKANPAREGHLIIMKPIGTISFEGVMDHTVHPLLIYTQLVTSHDDRADETAIEIYEKYIKPKKK